MNKNWFILSWNLNQSEFVDSLLKKHKEFILFEYISEEIINKLRVGEIVISYYCLN